MDLKELNELIDLFEKRSITELEYEESGFRIRLKKWTSSQRNGHVEGEQRASRGEVPTVEHQLGSAILTSDKFIAVHSPMVGTFFRSPSPSTEPFVKEGDIVEKGQPLCIIEAMKIMNEIESEASGKVVSILVENGQPVEYGELLFLIEPV